MKTPSNDTLSDENIAYEILKGNEIAFAQLYNMYWDLLYSSAFKVMNDSELCKDIVQDVFISIWEKPKVEEIENIKAYLLGSVKNKVLMALRKGKISHRHLSTLQELTINNTEESIEYKELCNKIEDSITLLPDKCKEVFRLSRIENFSNKEISEKLNISTRTVETHISNAIKKLRYSLKYMITFATVVLSVFLCK